MIGDYQFVNKKRLAQKASLPGLFEKQVDHIFLLLFSAQVCFYDHGIVQHIHCVTFEHDFAGLKDVGAVSDGEGHLGILLYQQHGCLFFFVNLFYYLKDLFYK